MSVRERGTVAWTIAIAAALVVAALSAACSSSSGGNGGDAGTVDAEVDAESDAAAVDAGDEPSQSPVYGCSEAQLAFATNQTCGQCVAQSCAALLRACTNCVLCEMQLTGCPACGTTCFARTGAPAPTVDSGP